MYCHLLLLIRPIYLFLVIRINVCTQGSLSERSPFEYLNTSPRYTHIRYAHERFTKRLHKDVRGKMTTRFGPSEFLSGQKSRSNCAAFFPVLDLLISLPRIPRLWHFTTTSTRRNSDVLGLLSVSLSLSPFGLWCNSNPCNSRFPCVALSVYLTTCWETYSGLLGGSWRGRHIWKAEDEIPSCTEKRDLFQKWIRFNLEFSALSDAIFDVNLLNRIK